MPEASQSKKRPNVPMGVPPPPTGAPSALYQDQTKGHRYDFPPPPPPPGAHHRMPPIAPSPYYRPRTNSKATTSMALGIVSIVCIIACFPVGFITGIIAVVLGISAKNEIAHSRGTSIGDGYAIAGIVMGVIGLCGSLLILLFFFVAL